MLSRLIPCLLLIGCVVSYTPMLAQVTAPSAYGAGGKVNYVRTWDAVKPDTSKTDFHIHTGLQVAKMTTQYMDGLGRPVETVMKQGSLITGGTATDLVSPVVYDSFGREQYKYLGFAANNTGSNTSLTDGLFKLNPFQEQAAFMSTQYTGQSETYYYGKTEFEASPLNRVTQSFAPGNSWVGSGRGVKSQYFFNTTTDSVRIWTVTDVTNNFGTYASSASYAAGELSKMITTDEQGKQVVEYKDKSGQTILKKIQLTAAVDTGTGKGYNGWLCTYYIYDITGRLRCVVQPEGVKALLAGSWSFTTTILNEQCFRYEYDLRSRMIRKKVPGADEVWMVYDARDRLVLTQDGNLRATAQKKWMYTVYDEMNRPVATGLMTDPTNYNDLSYHSTRADTSIAYPVLASYTTEELTRSFYDDYGWLATNGNPFDHLRNISDDGQFLTPSNTVYPYPQPIVQSFQTQGLVTGTKTKVLGTSSQYLYSISYYDDRGRMIQTRADNITGAVDIAQTQYDFTGKVLVQFLNSPKNFTPTRNDYLQSNFDYDSLGRVLRIRKKPYLFYNGNWYGGTEKKIFETEYDALGQLKKKKLGPEYNSGAGLDSLVYDYNIRGWLLGMNRHYAKDDNNSNFFGFDLGYDKTANGIIGNLSYAAAQYNGNIAGMVWKSKGDQEKRKYDFTYDAANRLLSADFNQYTSNTFNKGAGIDFSLSGMSYDANGNILGMKQKGLKLGGSVTIDSLAYHYISGSNKLLNVIDGVNDAQTKLGDFRTSTLHPASGSKTSTTTDYEYDVNGNMVKDLNKDIVTYAGANGIEYNYLNLPQKIWLKKDASHNKGWIEYLYDATGNKLKKTTYEPGVDTTTTLYVGGGVFKNDTLQFFGQEEGRIRFKAANGTFQYDYFIKDHLGNVRAVITEERDTSFYPAATLETTPLATERLYYAGVDTGRVNKSTVAGYPNDAFTSPNDFIQQLNGSSPKIGSNIVLKVMAGDQFNLRVSSWYKKNGATPATPINPLSNLLSALSNNIGAVSSVAGHGTTSGELTSSGILAPGASSFYGSHSTADSTTKPKAFVNWVLFDEQFKYVAASSGFEQVGADNTLTTHTRNALDISKNGYLYIYVSNETPNINVFFDNLQVTHIRGPLLEETHYYPWGLTMTGISSSKALSFGNSQNRFKFNDGTELESKEFSDESGLELYATTFRSLDPQIGRLWQVDPLADLSESWSPYVYANDNPIFYNDPFGLEADSAVNPPQCSGDACPTGKMAEVKELGEVVVKGVRHKTPPSNPATEVDLGDYKIPLNEKISPEAYIKLLGFDPYDPISVIQQTVVEKPDSWDRLWNGPFYRGRNAFNEKLYQQYYGGTTPSSGSFNRIGGFAKLFQIRSARSWEDLMQWGRDFDVVNKLRTVCSSDIVRLKNAGVTLEELKIWSDSYGQAINKVATKSNIIAKYRKDLVDKLIELW